MSAGNLKSPGRAALMRSPLHPVFVHFSVALCFGSFIFDLIGLAGHVPSLLAAGCWTLIAATLTTALTLVTGVWSRLHLPVEEGRARAWLRTHMALGPLIFGLLVALCPWRLILWAHDTLSGTYLLAIAGVVVIVLIQGYIGGELVYREGFEVRGRYRALSGQPAEQPPPKLFGSALPSPGNRQNVRP